MLNQFSGSARLTCHGRAMTSLPAHHWNAPGAPEIDRSLLLALHRDMLTARSVDETEAELVARGEAFFYTPCAGHEGVAALRCHLTPDDWLHLHYRDKVLLIARGVRPVEFFHNLLCNADSQSAGRQMAPFMSDPSRKILSQNIPVGNQALQAVGVA